MIRKIVLFSCLLAVTWSAWAGDCWVESIENKTTGFGDATATARYAGLRGSLLKADALLKADSAINAIQNVRYQVHRYIGASYHPGAPFSGQAMAYLHKPDMWLGKCGLRSGADIVHFVEIGVNLNNLRSLEEPAIGDDALAATKFIHQPKHIAERGGYSIYEGSAGNRILVMTAGNVPPFVPVTVGEYLDYWHRSLKQEREESRSNMQESADDREWRSYITQLRKTDPKAAAELQKSMDEAAHLTRDGAPESNAEWDELLRLKAALSPTQRARPVYLTSGSVERYRFGYAQANEEGAIALVKVNQVLWAGKRNTSEVRVVTLEVQIQDGESTRNSGADRWLDRVDVQPYLELLARGAK